MEINDVIIAGSGMAGLLSLKRLSEARPEWRFVLVEREPWLGGRMRSSLDPEGVRSCGMQMASSGLYDFILSEVKDELATVARVIQPLRTAGVMSGSKIQPIAFDDLTRTDFAKAIGGNAAAKDWGKIEELLGRETVSEETFQQAWTGDKKSAALVALEQLAHFWGVPELSGASIRPLQAGFRHARAGLHAGRWDLLFENTIAELRASDRLKIVTNAQIMAGRREEKTWVVRSTQGNFQAHKLLVAQSPWEAILWLEKDVWPSRLLNIAGKTKPVSVVVLSERIEGEIPDLPELLFVTAEDTQVLRLPGQIVYQSPINYELTVQAPAVVKAVKRLKRAKKKLSQIFPALATESGEHLALLPVGWTHSIHPPEQKWFEKVDAEHVQKPHLAFAGDSIGAGDDCDQRLIQSVQDATDALLKA